MAEKKPAKMSDADLKFFEEMLIEKRRQLVTAQSESEKANAFHGQKSQAGDGGDSDSADSATDYNALETTFSLAAREGKGGERRRLEIARALASDPSFLLLDEPFAGIDPIAVADIQSIISGLKERGMGVLITDHNVRETLSITDRAYIMYKSQVLTEGSSEYLANDPEARHIYLGDSFRLD